MRSAPSRAVAISHIRFLSGWDSRHLNRGTGVPARARDGGGVLLEGRHELVWAPSAAVLMLYEEASALSGATDL
jgi:hypothetical protein